MKAKMKGYIPVVGLAIALLTILKGWLEGGVGDQDASTYAIEAVAAAAFAYWQGRRSGSKAAEKSGTIPPIPPVTPALLLCLLLAPGCSMLTPGLDTRTAAEAKSVTTWGPDTLTLNEATTHNRKVVAAEGEGIEAEYYDTGSPKKVTGASYLLSQISEPEDVMKAYLKLAEKNAEVASAMLQALNQIAALYQPILMERTQQQGAAAQGNAAAGVATAEGIALLRDILGEAGVLPEANRTPPPPAAQPTNDPRADAVAEIKAAIARLRQRAATQEAP